MRGEKLSQGNEKMTVFFSFKQNGFRILGIQKTKATKDPMGAGGKFSQALFFQEEEPRARAMDLFFSFCEKISEGIKIGQDWAMCGLNLELCFFHFPSEVQSTL